MLHCLNGWLLFFNQILQDFSLMFGAEVASRFLEKWNTSFKEKVIQEARNLKETALLKQHLKAVLKEGSDPTDDPGTVIVKIVMFLLESINLLVKVFIDYFPKTFISKSLLKTQHGYFIKFSLLQKLISKFMLCEWCS